MRSEWLTDWLYCLRIATKEYRETVKEVQKTYGRNPTLIDILIMILLCYPLTNILIRLLFNCRLRKLWRKIGETVALKEVED